MLLRVACLFVLFLGMSVQAAEIQKLTITGASTLAPLVAEIGKRFERLNPNTRIDVQSGGSSRGLADARSGIANIGMVSRALKPEEADVQGAIVAYDGVSVILHASNPVREMTSEQIKAVFTGQVTNWKDIGGKDQKITVVNKAEGRSTLEVFSGYFGLKNSEIKSQVVIGDNQQGIKTVAGNSGAIGYVSIGAAEYEVTSKTPIKLLGLNGILANSANVQAGRFPLSRPLNLVTKSKADGLEKRFIEFARSAAVDDLVKAQFFVPIAH
jgi:phosphate transport system substrate-binding protein